MWQKPSLVCGFRARHGRSSRSCATFERDVAEVHVRVKRPPLNRAEGCCCVWFSGLKWQKPSLVCGILACRDRSALQGNGLLPRGVRKPHTNAAFCRSRASNGTRQRVSAVGSRILHTLESTSANSFVYATHERNVLPRTARETSLTACAGRAVSGGCEFWARGSRDVVRAQSVVRVRAARAGCGCGPPGACHASWVRMRAGRPAGHLSSSSRRRNRSRYRRRLRPGRSRSRSRGRSAASDRRRW